MPVNDPTSETRRSRRGFLRAATLGSATAVLRPSTLLAQERSRRSLGDGVGAYGERSPFETAMRRVRASRYDQAAGSLTPLQELTGSITPSALHFERHHAGIPEIDPSQHRLLIDGLGDRPLVFTMAELERLPAVSRIYFVECSGAGRVKWSPARPDTDGGKSWGEAQLQAPVLPLAHTRFHVDWVWDGSDTTLASRCIDETGDVQPTRVALIAARGTQSSYHNNAIQGWRVRPDGAVENVDV